MKVLMFMRDGLPPSRVDVSVLFDKTLRRLGIETDFVGPRGQGGGSPESPCAGRQFETGHRNDPRSLWRELRLLWRLAEAYDAVVVRDRPLAASALFVVARFRRTPCIYWMSFPMPLGDRVGASLHWSAGRRATAALTWLRGTFAQWVQDNFVLPRAHHVFVQSQAMLVQVLAMSALPQARLSAVPMGVDRDRLPELIDLPPPAAPCIAYLGSLDRARHLEVLIDAFVLVRACHVGARLVLVGSAPLDSDVTWLKAHAARCGVLDQVDFTGPLPMAQAWRHLLEASVCVSPVPPGPLHDVSSPTKVVEYLALAMPVVANDIPDQRHLLEACGGGTCVAFEAPAFARAILDLLDDLPAARCAARLARPRLLALRSYDVLGRQVAAELRAAAA